MKVIADQFEMFMAPTRAQLEQEPKLAEKAVLMRFSAGLPGEERKASNLTEEVKKLKGLGTDSGGWDARLYPKEALRNVKSKVGEARAYHDAVTLPFDNGIGILPAALIVDYGNRMREFKGQIHNLVESEFLSNPSRWIEWARKAHNGSFEPSFYPGCSRNEAGEIEFDEKVFIETMREKFYFRCDPLPVPDVSHFTDTVTSLLGVDIQSVNDRVKDATKEAVKTLFKRMLDPIKHMVDTLSKDSPKIFETLTGNILEIANLVPKLNIVGDPQLDKFAQEMAILAGKFDAAKLRKDEVARVEAKNEAKSILDRLSAYKL